MQIAQERGCREDALYSDLTTICNASPFVYDVISVEDYARCSAQRLQAFTALFVRAGYAATVQPFPYKTVTLHNAFFGAWRRPGALWITAHYDYKRGVGACDNGTAMALMLEVARRLPWWARRYVAFGSFGGEERQMLGAKWFATHTPHAARYIGAVLNLECLAARGWTTAVATRYRKLVYSDQRLVRMLQEADPCLSAIEVPSYHYSDHIQLARFGVPTAVLTGVPNKDAPNHIHTEKDVLDSVYVPTLARLTETVLSFVQAWVCRGR